MLEFIKEFLKVIKVCLGAVIQSILEDPGRDHLEEREHGHTGAELEQQATAVVTLEDKQEVNEHHDSPSQAIVETRRKSTVIKLWLH